MTYSKMLGVAALTTIALILSAGSGSASAASSWCHTAEGHVAESACPAGWADMNGQKVKLTSPSAVLNGSSFTVTCASTAEGTLGFGGAVKIESLTFTGCSGSCSEASAVNLPYPGQGVWTGGESGTLTVSGNPGAELKHCTVFNVSCTYSTASVSMAFEGSMSEPAELKANVALTRTGSTLCPSEETWTATYTAQSGSGLTPSIALLSQPEASWCHTAEGHVAESACPAGWADMNGQKVKLTSPSAVLNGSSFTVTCASTAEGTLGFGGAVKIESLTFTGCSGSCSEASAVNLPYPGQGVWTGGESGTLTVSGNPGAELKHCTVFNVSCTYSTASVSMAFEGSMSEPAELKANVALTRTGSTLCPSEETWTATYTAQSGSGLTPSIALLSQPEASWCHTAEGHVAESACPAGWADMNGQKVKLTSPSAVLNGSSFTVTCASTAEGTLGFGGAVKIESLTFTGCSGSCSEASAVNLPYPGQGVWTGGESGTLTVSGNPGAELKHCTVFNVSCTYSTASVSMAFEGSMTEPAELKANVALTRTGSTLCPSEETWTATYTAQSGSGLTPSIALLQTV